MSVDINRVYVQINSNLKIEKLCKILELQHIVYEDKIALCCFYHGDKHPSAFIDLKYNKFHCSTCGKKLSAILYFIHYLLLNKRVPAEVDAVNYLKEFTTGQEKFINLNIVEVFHQQLLESEPYQAIIAEKGITLELIKKHRIGIHHTNTARFTIPVLNAEGFCEALLSYLPDAKTNKFYFFNPENKKELKQQNSIYLVDQFKYESIMVCGGPLKAAIAAHELNNHNIGAVSFTTGEGTSVPEIYRHLFKNKKIYVCFDVDKAGISGARRLLQCLIIQTKFLYIVNLPLNLLKYPKGDITNYIVDEKQKLFPLLSNPEVTTPFDTVNTKELLSQEIIQTTFKELTHGERIPNQLYQLDVKTIGYSEHTVHFITKVVPVCERNTNYCQMCKIFRDTPEDEHEIDTDHPLQIPLLNSKEQNTIFKQTFGIPQVCRMVAFAPSQRISAQECELSSATLSPTEQAVVQRGFFIASTPSKDDICLNIIAREVVDESSNPVLLIRKATKTNNIFLNEPTHEECLCLATSSPTEWSLVGLQQWFNNRYGYLEAQHGIIGRSKMNFLIDLTFHSILQFEFNNNLLNGWISLMILGDTGTGKSTMLKKLFELYQYGTLKYQSTGSRAGWVGGLVKSHKNKMFYKPGVLPLNDGGLVCIEELKNFDESILQAFITAMSDGFVDISFIQAHQSQARVRLIFTSNPRKSNMLTKEPSINLMKGLLGTEEAFRRIDCAYVTFKDSKFLEQKLPEGQIDKNILPLLVQYAWSRKVDNVKFEDDAINAIFNYAQEFSKEYDHPNLLLVDPSSQHNKFAKLATAFACLTYSVQDEIIIVQKCHVDFIANILHEIYNGEELGYKSSVVQNNKYTLLEFDEHQKALLKQFYTAADINTHINILNNLQGTFDNNQFIALFVDRLIGINIFAWALQLGFLQPIDNKTYSVSQKWKKYYAKSLDGRQDLPREDASLTN